MSRKVILYSGWYSPALCQRHPDKVFVFGDNLMRFGKGGQAVIRDEPNALGVSTKRKPSMGKGSFFTEGNGPDLDLVLRDLRRVWDALKAGKTIVIPVVEGTQAPSLGLERAELKQRAPSLYATIETHVKEMVETYGGSVVETEDDL